MAGPAARRVDRSLASWRCCHITGMCCSRKGTRLKGDSPTHCPGLLLPTIPCLPPPFSLGGHLRCWHGGRAGRARLWAAGGNLRARDSRTPHTGPAASYRSHSPAPWWSSKSSHCGGLFNAPKANIVIYAEGTPEISTFSVQFPNCFAFCEENVKILELL